MSTIDLSTLAAPTIVVVKDFETILAEMLAELAGYAPTLEIAESDPAYKVLEVAAYREMLIRQEAQDGGKQVMLTYATGANLDQLGANYDCARKTDETDADYRARIALSLEAISTAGSRNSYIYHALSVDGVADVSAIGPDDDAEIDVDPGNVIVTVLAAPTEDAPEGTPTAELLAEVVAALNDEDVRPLTDTVTVQAVALTEFSIAATLYFYSGPDAATIMEAAQAAVEAYVTECHKIGYDVARSGIFRALHQTGVQRVTLTLPATDVAVDAEHVSYCPVANIALTSGGTNT